ncbi:MAG: hypothetical protein IJC25_01870 [Clostridia bacterium]|nr:hypothetical protein [Clostridia bacterium]
MSIEATLRSAQSVFEGIAASAAAGISAAFGGVDLSGLQGALGSLNGAFADVLGGIMGLSDSFGIFSGKVSGILIPPIFSAIEALDRLFALIGRLSGNPDAGSSSGGSSGADLSKAPLGAIQSAFSVQSSAASVSSAVNVNLNATLVADGYQMARVAMRNLDDVVAAL